MRLTILENKLENLINSSSPYTNVIGIARSLLAIGTLLTLLTNDVAIFMPVRTDGVFINPLLQSPTAINQFNFFLLFGISNVFIAKWLAILVLLVVISGYYPQVTSLLHWWINVSFIYFSTVVDGGDHIAAIITLLLIPLCLSDPRRNHWFRQSNSRKSPLNIIGISSILLIRIQVAVVYLHAATGKFINNEWIDGTATYYWFNHSILGMSPLVSYFLNPILSSGFGVTLITYAVLVLELTLFAAIGMSAQRRKWVFPFAIAFHGGIILVHGIFSFFFSMAACLVLYLIDSRKDIAFKWKRAPAALGEKAAIEYALSDLKTVQEG